MIGEALRLIRVFHDMKQSDLAARLGVSKSYLSEIESGKKVPRVDLIQRYASEFSVSASSILFFSENLEDSTGSIGPAAEKKKTIAKKILGFLRLIEERTAHAAGD